MPGERLHHQVYIYIFSGLPPQISVNYRLVGILEESHQVGKEVVRDCA